jgi:hypothetical protein
MRDYVDLRASELCRDIDSIKELTDVKIKALEVATSLAKANLELRLESMNEWRQQSKDREELFARRDTVRSIEERVGQLEISKAVVDGKASQFSVNMAYVISAIGILLGVASLILRLK